MVIKWLDNEEPPSANPPKLRAAEYVRMVLSV